MSVSEMEMTRLDADTVLEGFRQLLPIAFFVVIFGAAFGLAAAQKGLDTGSIMAMSALVFAGYAQFAALDLWGAQVPVVPLVIAVFAINARHILMGATLYPWLRHVPPARRYAIALVLSDANWAMALQAFNRARPGVGLLLGGGLAIWSAWVVGTWLGIRFGNQIHDPVSLGLDMVMGCFLLSMVAEGRPDARMIAIWVTAGLASLGAFVWLPENSHVVVGALAGGALGAVWMENDHDD